MWKDILIDNSDNILKALDNYSKNLNEIKEAIKNAKKSGIGFVGIKKSSHYGLSGFYAEKAVKTRNALNRLIKVTEAFTRTTIRPFNRTSPNSTAQIFAVWNLLEHKSIK